MIKIENVEDALKFLRETGNFNVHDISKFKYWVKDEDVNFMLENDKELTDYACEQRNAMSDEED